MSRPAKAPAPRPASGRAPLRIVVHRPRMARLRDLQKSRYNPREMNDEERAGLRASLEAFGLVENIVFNRRTRRIVGGHQRFDALRAAGVEEAPVIEVDLPPEKEKALNIALNNPHIAGRFTPAVVGLLDEIQVELPDVFTALRLDTLAEGLEFDGGDDRDGGGASDAAGARASLAERFLVPPFSVLDARQGYWQERKRAWLALGIDSEVGRGENLLNFSASVQLKKGRRARGTAS